MLIITQKVNKNDPVLGFFHDWIIEFAKHVPKLTVICLEKGEYDLPANVEVFSLGKEKGYGKMRLLVRFFYLALTRKYKTVFVHMNQEYLLCMGLFWKISGKKVLFWRNHPKGNVLTRIAIMFADVAYCTSQKSFTYAFKKTKQMPVGVSTILEFENRTIAYKLLCFGRISPIKNIEVVADTYLLLREKLSNLTLDIVGDPTENDQDKQYYQYLISKYQSIKTISFLRGVSHENIKNIYAGCDVLINATPPGSFDKTIIEAMTFGIPVFTCQDIWKNTDFEYLNKYFLYESNNTKQLSEKIMLFYQTSEFEKKELQKAVFDFAKKYHSLELLVTKVIQDI